MKDVVKYLNVTKNKYGQKNPYEENKLPHMIRRLESVIRASIWHHFRLPIWRAMCKRVEDLFAIGIRRLKSLSINIALVRNKTLTARTIGIYAVRKLIAQNRVGAIFKPLVRYMAHLFSGLKVVCRGRFTRRQRASLMMFSKGSIKLSTFTSDIDYAYVHVPLKFGVGCIKIWVNRGFRNKYHIANNSSYKPNYKLKKSKTLGLTEEQRNRFIFKATPRLTKMAIQLKRAILPTSPEPLTYTKVRKLKNGYISQLAGFATTTTKTLLYKYARYRGTSSYRYVKVRTRNLLQQRTKATEFNKHINKGVLNRYINAYRQNNGIVDFNILRQLYKKSNIYTYLRTLFKHNIFPNEDEITHRTTKLGSIDQYIKHLLYVRKYKILNGSLPQH